jgi:ankyrin repeat protein
MSVKNRQLWKDLHVPEGDSVLHAMINAGVDTLEHLTNLDQMVEPDVKNKLGRSALWQAAYMGNVHMLQALISAGGNVNTVSNTGMTPLHAVAQWCRGDARACVVALAAAGASWEARYKGRTCIQLARSVGRAAFADAMEDIRRRVLDTAASQKPVTAALYGAGDTVYSACMNTHIADLVVLNDVGVLDQYWKSGGNIHALDHHGMTALMVAALYRLPEVVEWCIRRGVGRKSIDALCESQSVTALLCSVYITAEVLSKPHEVLDEPECPRLLIQAGADIHQLDRGGNCILQLAVRAECMRVVQYLLTLDAMDVAFLFSSRNNKGETVMQQPHAKSMGLAKFLADKMNRVGPYMNACGGEGAAKSMDSYDATLVDDVRFGYALAASFNLPCPVLPPDSDKILCTAAASEASTSTRSPSFGMDAATDGINRVFVDSASLASYVPYAMLAEWGHELDADSSPSAAFLDALASLPDVFHCVDVRGNTVLMIACAQRRPALVRWCLDACPSVARQLQARNDMFQTCVHRAVQRDDCPVEYEDDVTCLRLLIDAGADVNIVDYVGRCALHYACTAGLSALCECLRTHGKCDVMITDRLGRTPGVSVAGGSPSKVMNILCTRVA